MKFDIKAIAVFATLSIPAVLAMPSLARAECSKEYKPNEKLEKFLKKEFGALHMRLSTAKKKYGLRCLESCSHSDPDVKTFYAPNKAKRRRSSKGSDNYCPYIRKPGVWYVDPDDSRYDRKERRYYRYRTAVTRRKVLKIVKAEQGSIADGSFDAAKVLGDFKSKYGRAESLPSEATSRRIAYTLATNRGCFSVFVMVRENYGSLFSYPDSSCPGDKRARDTVLLEIQLNNESINSWKGPHPKIIDRRESKKQKKRRKKKGADDMSGAF